MSKPIWIEKTKSVILVVLFLSTVLLLYFLWGNISFDDFKPSSVKPVSGAPDTADLMRPEQIIVSFGADNYTVLLPGEIWYDRSNNGGFVGELGKFGPAENTLVEEIAKDKYLQIRSLRSIWAEFQYDIPLKDFCDNFKMKKSQNYDVIETVTEIGYSTVDGNQSLFILDGKNNKHYRLFSDISKGSENQPVKTEFPELIDSVEAAGFSIYYPVGQLSGIKNETLVPLAIKTSLKSFPYRQESYSYQTEKISDMAEEFFGGNFDFVRKITEENGTVIYMYGYGQTVLIVNTDGSIEYKEEPTASSGGQSLTEALDIAINFVSSHGFSWEPMEDAGFSMYLKDVLSTSGKEKGYRFIFGLEINGNRLYYERGEPIVVEVVSGQVTYYNRNMIDFDMEDLGAIDADASQDSYDTFSAVNLIAQNYRYIYDILLLSEEVHAVSEKEEMFEIVSSMVNNMQTGYVKPDRGENMEIQPAWIVRIGDIEVYFDLYTAEPIGYSRQ